MQTLKENSGFDKTRRCGMTLVEVILGIAILAIMAVMAAGALFYPRHLVVTYALKQNAINAGTDAIERLFFQKYITISNEPAKLNFRSAYTVNGRTVTNTVYAAEPEDDLGTGAEWLHITVNVTYPGSENPVVLETYRASLK